MDLGSYFIILVVNLDSSSNFLVSSVGGVGHTSCDVFIGSTLSFPHRAWLCRLQICNLPDLLESI
jgi:hypothetical protein